MNEESFVRKLVSSLPQGRDVSVGPGDDCAAIDLGLDYLVLAAADQVIAGVHYLEGSTSPEKIARKLLNRNVSDIASMGGIPTHALVTLALNPLDEKWLTIFHKALQETASGYGISIIGGDIAKLNNPGQVCSLSILGRVKRDKLCLRANAKPGDLLFCTGLFGNSFASGKHLSFKPRLEEAQFLAGRFSCAMIDVSDGLLKDARRMAEASGLSLKASCEKVPLAPDATLEAALGEGEDYELLFATPPAKAEELAKAWPFAETPLTCIGLFESGKPGRLLDVDGNALNKKHCGFDHFNEKKNR